MGKAKEHVRTAAEGAGLVLLFAAVVCYIFAALGLLALGVILLPTVLLGRTGVLVVTTDLAQTPLLLISGGILLLGLGMCICIVPLCKASYDKLKSVMRAAEIRGKMLREADDIPGAAANDDTDEAGVQDE